MVCRFLYLATIIAIATTMSVVSAGCSSATTAAEFDQQRAGPCGDDCIQPPLRRSELVDHLSRHQERILSREDYKQRIPPPISTVIYGSLPNEPLRDGPDVVDDDGQPYDGDLNWHRIAFDDVHTDDADHRSLRGRNVSGAHCFFAHKPNRLTAIFALLVVHHRDRGDVLYLGGPNHPVDRLDTVPVTDRFGSRLRVDTDDSQGMLCAFRNDQQQMGALIIPFEYTDVGAPDNGPHYAVFTIITGAEKEDTGEITQVTRTAGLYGTRTVEKTVPVKKYRAPKPEFVDSFSSLHDAIVAAEEAIVPGRFRLRPEFVYPQMPYLSYLDTGREEFCPAKTRCKTPPKYLDKDIVPPLTLPDEPDEHDEDSEPVHDREEVDGTADSQR